LAFACEPIGPPSRLSYLTLDLAHDDALEAALAVYEPALGHTLSRARIRLYNAACAIDCLAFRGGVPPDEPMARPHAGRGRAMGEGRVGADLADAGCGVPLIKMGSVCFRGKRTSIAQLERFRF
jgi:hypothetical protein